MRRTVLIAAAVCAAALAGASGGRAATGECKGLRVCVPVAGPWVVATTQGAEFQLDCPKRFIVGGLDAELSSRAIEVAFAGGLGSPVNPGITTTGSAVFTGHFVGTRGFGSFRPHIGCVPSSQGGRRTPTAYHAFRPGKPTVRVVQELPVLPSLTMRVAARCPTRTRLIRFTEALAFYSATPPAAVAVAAVHVRQSVQRGVVHVAAHGGSPGATSRTIVQVDLTCAVGT